MRRSDREDDRYRQEQRAIKDGSITTAGTNRIEHLKERVRRYQANEVRAVAHEARTNGIRAPKKPSKSGVWAKPAMRGFTQDERLNLPARPLEYPGILHTPRIKGPGYPLRKRNK